MDVLPLLRQQKNSIFWYVFPTDRTLGIFDRHEIDLEQFLLLA